LRRHGPGIRRAADPAIVFRQGRQLGRLLQRQLRIGQHAAPFLAAGGIGHRLHAALGERMRQPRYRRIAEHEQVETDIGVQHHAARSAARAGRRSGHAGQRLAWRGGTVAWIRQAVEPACGIRATDPRPALILVNASWNPALVAAQWP